MIRNNLYTSMLIIVISTALLTGCNTLSPKNSQSASSEWQAEQQTQDFFSQHPDYVSSKEKESQLFAEFQALTREPAYINMSMYQLLIIAHDRLQRQY
ncbi:TPA: invasion protein [Escherichia fergusonii]|uniref:invasion protein n=1 Tax=Escherichia fergusonii TaxID=564 RepID=UPI000F67ED6E|nr:invasion protein [Escherichia fergusonii]EHG5998742.1 invasion protein [Escherichia fergusonii]MBA8500737.1 invasion protein [Escherichia fergusonii]QCZ31449.1 invasion protein [Escherichia fergusonii]HAI1306445.1 invasion protein [Escherichia fergusonii]HCO8235807.1 invasion protein [Escherichia fergusonii]